MHYQPVANSVRSRQRFLCVDFFGAELCTRGIRQVKTLIFFETRNMSWTQKNSRNPAYLHAKITSFNLQTKLDPNSRPVLKTNRTEIDIQHWTTQTLLIFFADDSSNGFGTELKYTPHRHRIRTKSTTVGHTSNVRQDV